jgi:hypothetical protein
MNANIRAYFSTFVATSICGLFSHERTGVYPVKDKLGVFEFHRLHFVCVPTLVTQNTR